MCAQVELQTGPGKNDWVVLSSVNDLRKHWEVRPDDLAPMPSDSPYAEGEFCLCGVDVERVLDRAGVTYECDNFLGDYVVRTGTSR